MLTMLTMQVVTQDRLALWENHGTSSTGLETPEDPHPHPLLKARGVTETESDSATSARGRGSDEERNEQRPKGEEGGGPREAAGPGLLRGGHLWREESSKETAANRSSACWDSAVP
ncbi:unnamed protein product [Lota lota]